MKIQQLDGARLAEALLRVPLISCELNHDTVAETATDFIAGDGTNNEAAFIRDLFALDTDAVIEKWYGGDEAARELIEKIK